MTHPLTLMIPRDRVVSAMAAVGLSPDALRTDLPGIYRPDSEPRWGFYCTMRQVIEFTAYLAASGVNVGDLALHAAYKDGLVSVPHAPDELVLYFRDSALTD